MNMNWGDSFPMTDNSMSFPGGPIHQSYGFEAQPVPEQPFGISTFDMSVVDMGAQSYDKPRSDGAFSGACFRCGESGHISRRCPAAQRENQSRPRGACRRCGEEGHYAKSCPMGPRDDEWKSGGGGGGGEGTSFEIYREDVGRIIGKGGNKIKELENESGSRIKIARNEHPPRCILFGTPSQCDHARRLIENLTTGNGRRGGAGDFRRPNGDRHFDDSRLDENLFR